MNAFYEAESLQSLSFHFEAIVEECRREDRNTEETD